MCGYQKRVVKNALLMVWVLVASLGIKVTVYALPDVSGTWAVEFLQGTKTTMTLQQSGENVTGTLEPTDGSRKQVVGRIVGQTLTLSRDTGLETVQRYQATVEGDRFNGNFWNEGKYPGKGTFNGVRVSQPNVSGTWAVEFLQGTKTTMTLQQAGENVTGTLEPTDGSRKQVVGRIVGQSLTLSRDTGLETVQHYQVTVEGDRFNGNFWNMGKYPGKGTFSGIRQ